MFWNYNGPSCNSSQTKSIQSGDVVVAVNKSFAGNVTTSHKMNKAMNYHIGRVVNFAPISLHQLEQVADKLQAIDTILSQTKHPLCSVSYEIIESHQSSEKTIHIDDPSEFKHAFQKKKSRSVDTTVIEFYGTVCRFDSVKPVLNWFKMSPNGTFVKQMYGIRLRVTELYADCYLYRVVSMNGSSDFGKDLKLKPIFPYANFDLVKLRKPNMLQEVVELSSHFPNILRQHALYYTSFLKPESVQFVSVDYCREAVLDDIIDDVQSKYMSYYNSNVHIFREQTSAKIHDRIRHMQNDRGQSEKNDLSNKKRLLNMVRDIQSEILNS